MDPRDRMYQATIPKHEGVLGHHTRAAQCPKHKAGHWLTQSVATILPSKSVSVWEWIRFIRKKNVQSIRQTIFKKTKNMILEIVCLRPIYLALDHIHGCSKYLLLDTEIKLDGCVRQTTPVNGERGGG